MGGSLGKKIGHLGGPAETLKGPAYRAAEGKPGGQRGQHHFLVGFDEAAEKEDWDDDERDGCHSSDLVFGQRANLQTPGGNADGGEQQDTTNRRPLPVVMNRLFLKYQ